MSDDVIVAEFLSIVERLGLSDIQAGVLAGISPHTARFVRATRRAPKRPRCVQHMRVFAELNREATDRGSLRLVA